MAGNSGGPWGGGGSSGGGGGRGDKGNGSNGGGDRRPEGERPQIPETFCGLSTRFWVLAILIVTGEKFCR